MAQIFQHPVSHNIEWRAVLSLLEAVASVSEHTESRYLVTLGAETEMLDRPKNKDVEDQQVVDLRRMLANAGYGPTANDAESTSENPASSSPPPDGAPI